MSMPSHAQMIKDIEDSAYEPTDWEQEFIESVEQRLCDDKNLTGKQESKLMDIWGKAMGHG